jgi:V-type H+-transporting ATPase proteolipid subunit
MGASYGTAKSSIGISSAAILRPDMMVKMCIPIVMAGILAIYGLVVCVIMVPELHQNMSLFQGLVQLGAGLSVGLAALAAGFSIGIIGDSGVRGTGQQPKLFVAMMLMLIFAEVLGIYGMIVALLLNAKGQGSPHC